MRVVGAIPARWGSTRFPGKSLYPICGKPLVVWVVEAARRARRLHEVLVATDDARIAAAVAGTGARAVMTRPDHPSGTDRVAEAAAPGDSDIVVNIQGDEPLIDPALIDGLVAVLESDPRWDMATAACPLLTRAELDGRNVVKVVCSRDGGALYFSRLPIPCRRDGEPDLSSGLYRRHIGIYAYRGAFLRRLVREPPCALERAESLEQLRALDLGGRIAVVAAAAAGVGVDTPEDVGYVEAVMRGSGRPAPGTGRDA
jgi:3-deoxy-manno-octulosonate cytidylyltransferase (CMP-KDO synthetase)